MGRLALIIAVATAAAVLAAGAQAGSSVAYGIQDDAWLGFGAGTGREKVAEIQGLGLQTVRVTVRWDVVERTQGTFDWTRPDAMLEPLRDAGVAAVVTLVGTPEWANGGRPANVAPTRGADFAVFARAVAERYPEVRKWTIWNEPNQRRWLSTASPVEYVTKLLNPAYAAIHTVTPSARVAGGVTAPRGGTGGLSPVAFIRGMGRLKPKLDAYAHHPYALIPGETPWSGGCAHCETISMSTIGRLVTETGKAFGPIRLWLTELGYQSNPPDRILGVPLATQASFVAAAAYIAWATPRVDLLIQYLYRDEPNPDHWQSGLQTAAGTPKPALSAMLAPLAQVSRRTATTRIWGAIRPGSGTRSYRLQRWTGSGWTSVGGVQRTRADGTILRSVRASAGTRWRLLAGGVAGNTLVVR